MKNLPLSLLTLALAATSFPGAAGTAGPRPYAAELSRKVEQLRSDVQARGWQFQVGVNPALQYDLERLCGTRAELMPAEDMAHEPGGFENFEAPETLATLPKGELPEAAAATPGPSPPSARWRARP